MEKEIETKTITLMPYLPEHLHQLSQFYLPDTQTPFSALPDESLKYCREDCDRHSIVILAKGIPVGFFVLHIGENITRFTSDKKAILLRGFLIDQKHQGKGIAKKALQILPEFAKGIFPNKDSIILAVNVMNVIAKTLYVKSGFQDTGIQKEGRSGWMEIMEYRLDMGNKDME
ncbi:GNAT family N-acetyltransferase [Peribacillus frigoritolerans]|uniref:GNAT family N-acetyltransferase n=1 Tax=Peribacillus frigoritolerans TaxID=450367 RepID=UPI0025A2AE8B|nr:GNAT family N-acetyltransferase [Peribacillus frigoritolerans]MDM5304208.1 GNAT family N-acetyltransferase [Peribacillus frigoritolerans]